MAALLAALMLALAACEQRPTPFPVDMPGLGDITGAPVISPPASEGSIRYGLATNTENSLPDLDLLTAVAQVEQLTGPVDPATLGAGYDLIAAYGAWPGAERSPVLPRVALVINPALPPLDALPVLEIVRSSLDPAAAVPEIPGADIAPAAPRDPLALRQELANTSWPDGFDLVMAYMPLPGMDIITAQLERVNFTIRRLPYTPDLAGTHLLLIVWTTPEERATWAAYFGEGTVFVDLYSLPISYWAAPGLPVTFTPGGWPLPG